MAGDAETRLTDAISSQARAASDAPPVMAEHLDLLKRYARAVPADDRTFDVPEISALTYFGLDSATLDELCQAGLPSVRLPEGRFFSFADLHFLALRSGRPTAYGRGITSWANSLRELSGGGKSVVDVTLVPQEVATNAVVVLPDRSITRALEERVPAAVITAEQIDPDASIPVEIRELAIAISGYDFYLIPDRSQNRSGIARSIRAGDCESVATLMREELEALGYRVRTRFGLLLSVPYSTEHVWIEALVDGNWLALDPLMLSLMKRFGGLDEVSWPPYRPVNAAVIGVSELSLGELPTHLVTTEGRALLVTFLTRIRRHPNL